MKTPPIYWVIALVAVVGGWWLWTMKTTPPATPAQQPSTSAQVNVQTPPFIPTLGMGTSATLGNYLTAENGMTLYRYSKDTSGVSNCSGACAGSWPPYEASPDTLLSAAPNISGRVGVITRTDGKEQLTYNGVPLYYWARDVKPGDTTGQNVGGVWFVVKPWSFFSRATR